MSAPGHGDVIDKLLGRISDELTLRFAGVFAHETVDRHVRESNQALHRTATITAYVPVIAEHFATERLTALAQAKGAIAKTMPEALFVCVHNAGRSQMAAAQPRRAVHRPRPLRRVDARRSDQPGRCRVHD